MLARYRGILIACCVLCITGDNAQSTDLNGMNATLSGSPARCPQDSSPVQEYKHYEDYCGANYEATMSPADVSACQNQANATNGVISKYNAFLFDHKCGGSLSDAKPLTGAGSKWSNLQAADTNNNNAPTESDPGALVNFDHADRVDTKEGWQDFLRDFPNSPYAAIARRHLERLSDAGQSGWRTAPDVSSSEQSQTSNQSASGRGSSLRCYPEYVSCNHDCLAAFGNDWQDKGAYCGGTCSTPQVNGQRCFNADGNLNNKRASIDQSQQTKNPIPDTSNARRLVGTWTITNTCPGPASVQTDKMRIAESGNQLILSGNTAFRVSWGYVRGSYSGLSVQGDSVSFIWTASGGNTATHVGRISGSQMSGTYSHRIGRQNCHWVATKD